MDQFSAALFGEEFQWGVSTAAFQTEGSPHADGKGPSIWDDFTIQRSRSLNGQNAAVACDFYRRYAEDISLVSGLGIPNFRFSIAWPRIFPSGQGAVNQKGIDYYNRVIDTCLEKNVTPWVTLYHWDLPSALEARGGWTNRDTVDRLADFARTCASAFGDRVKHWMVLNEPMGFTGTGYFLGIHAPGRRGLKPFLSAAHHAVLAMGAGGRAIRSVLPGAEIGTTFSSSHVEPVNSAPRHLIAAARVDALLNRLFLEPVLGLGYPVHDLPVLKRIDAIKHVGDDEHMAFDFDFIGVQTYTREIIRHSFLAPYIRARQIPAAARNVPVTAMNWEIYPDSIYHILKKFGAYPQIRKLIVTENGAAFPDSVTADGKVIDPQRKAFLEEYLRAVLKAKDEGCPVAGYFVWTLTDNFEWAEGFRPRFGLVHVDFESQQRIVKESGRWYSEFIGK